MVLKWLGSGKLDHPLADEKGAKEVFASIPKTDAAKAIEEIRHWVESVVTTEGFKTERRVELVMQLDEAVQPHQQKLSRDFLFTPGLSKFQAARLWGELSVLWSDMAAAYAACIDQVVADSGSASRLKPQLPLMAMRSLRACASQLKWRYMHYEPGAPGDWENFAKAYRFAETKKIQKESVTPYPRASLPSSVEREFTRALMLAASSPGSLAPVEIELAERIIEHLSALFVLGNTQQAQSTYNYIDLSGNTPPKRITQPPPPAPGLRFFAAGAANEKLEALIKTTQGGALPTDLSLGGSYEPSKVLRVLRHLKANWAATPPVRKHDRYEVEHKLNVVNGFQGVHGRVQEGAAGGAEVWMTRNISSGGIGAAVGKSQGDWVGIGRLVGLSVEGGSGACSVGTVRRCYRGDQRELLVGVRTFAKTAHAITLEGIEPPEALLLSDGGTIAEDALICMREGGYSPRISPKMAFNGNNYLLVPIEVVESGEDFEVARYRPMRQG
jgi:hypothetical protein